jgi:type II secretory pathway pseudopilin PulG
VAIAGMALESRLVVWAAIGILAASAIIRLVLAVRARRAESEAEESDG